MSKPPEWRQFRVGQPSTRPNWEEPDCCRLTRVYHVAHVKDAIRILEDGRIRSGLVYDDSRLNTKRTCVSWVSPNFWHDGSIYGNVQFIFDWKALIKARHLYWVEHLQTGRQQIIRLLITEQPYTDEKLQVFDPRTSDGPLYYDVESKRWYFNGTLTNEYMILADLPLAECIGVSFCDHHPNICKKKSEPCSDKDLKEWSAGALVLGHLLGTGMGEQAKLFEWDGKPGHVDPSARASLSLLSKNLTDAHSKGAAVEMTPATAKSLIASMCLAASGGKTARVKNLAKLFPSRASIEAAFTACVKQAFGGLKLD